MRFTIMLAATGCSPLHGLDGDTGFDAFEPPAPDARFAVQDGAVEISPAPGSYDWSADVDVAWVFDHTEGGVSCTFVPRAGSCEPTSEPWTILLGGEGSHIGTLYPCMCADVTCTDKTDGAVLAAWFWDLGHVCE